MQLKISTILAVLSGLFLLPTQQLNPDGLLKVILAKGKLLVAIFHN